MHHFFSEIERLLHWLLRLRHRQGYGIHSPFAFSFVTGVVYEQGTYYAYEHLAEKLKATLQAPLRGKDYRLLFRLANFQHPHTCWLLHTDNDPLIKTYLTAGSKHTVYEHIQRKQLTDNQQADMIVAGTGWENMTEPLIEHLRPGGLLIVIGLKNKAQRKAWKQLINKDQARVSFDLRDFGLLFTHEKLQREHYIINYR